MRPGSDPLSSGASPPMTGASTADADPEGLGRRVRAGLRWSVLDLAVGRIWALVFGIIMARLLDPTDYGVFAVALVALNILVSLNDLGMHVAVARWPGDVDRLVPTATTVSLVTSGVAYAGCFLAAPHFAAAVGAPEASGVIRLLALSLLVDGAVSVPMALMARAFQQNRWALANFASFLPSAVVTLLLARAGYGAWSLAWGQVVGNLAVLVAVLIMAPGRPTVGFDRHQARQLLSFGLPLAGSSLFVFAMLNVDYIVVGSLLGPLQLGFYAMAFNLSNGPSALISDAVRRVSLVGFSQISHDAEALKSRFSKSLVLLVTVAIPICLLLSMLAGPLIRVLYGSRWGPAARVLAFLAFMGGVRVAVDLGWDVLAAVGKSRAAMVLQGAWLAALIPSLVLGTRLDGIRGAGIAQSVVAILIAVPAMLLALRPLHVRPSELGRALARPALGGVVSAGVILATKAAVSPDVGRLVLGGGLGLASYLMVVVRRDEARAAVRLVVGRRSRAATMEGDDRAGGAMHDVREPAAAVPDRTTAGGGDGG